VDGKQYPALWGYPKTVWWLKDKGIGDELRVLLETTGDWPDEVRASVATSAAPLRSIPDGTESCHGRHRQQQSVTYRAVESEGHAP